VKVDTGYVYSGDLEVIDGGGLRPDTHKRNQMVHVESKPNAHIARSGHTDIGNEETKSNRIIIASGEG
jgi:hypothetical protein